VDPLNEYYVICAARGAGKTKLLSVIACWYAVVLSYLYKKPMRVLILSGTLEQAKFVYEYIKSYYVTNEWFRSKVKDEPLSTITVFKEGLGEIRVVPKTQVVGPHPNLFICDEAVKVPDPILEEALPMVDTERPKRVILSSTPYEYLTKAVDIFENHKKYGYIRFNWGYQECSWLDHRRAQQIREEYGENSSYYRIHYLGLPTALTGTVFNERDLRECLVERVPMLCPEDCFLGIDWGREHPTVFMVVQPEGENYNIIYSKGYREERWENLLEKAITLVQKFPIRTVFADAENEVMNERLKENLWKEGVMVRPVVFKTEKEALLAHLRFLIEQHKIRIAREFWQLVDQLRKYTYGTKKNDDYVDALMLACKGSRKKTIKTPFIFSKVKREEG